MVVSLLEKAKLRHVLKSLVHPAAFAAIVLIVAVKELLDRQLRQLAVSPRYGEETLDGRGCAESPAATAAVLIVRCRDLAFLVPVL